MMDECFQIENSDTQLFQNTCRELNTKNKESS